MSIIQHIKNMIKSYFFIYNTKEQFKNVKKMSICVNKEIKKCLKMAIVSSCCNKV